MEFKKESLKTPEGTAVAASLVCGLFAHLFGLVNVLHNFDDIVSQPGGYGIGVHLGRWLLEILGRFFEKIGLNYNLPVINGLIFLIFIAVSAGFLVSALRIQSRFSAALMGMLMAVFPTVTATLFYRYTVPFYGLGILLSVLTVWITNKWPRGGILPSAICLALAMGIYQAYAPVSIALFVLLLLQQTLEGKTNFGKLVLRGLYYCGILLLGVGLYFLCQQGALMAFGADLMEYRGVDTMGQLSLADMPGLLWQAFDSFCAMPFQDYCGLATRKIVKLTYLLLAGLTAVMLVVILACKLRSLLLTLMTAGLCLLFPIAVNFIVVMCPDNWIYTLMVYSFVLVGCAPLVIAEQLPPLQNLLGRAKPHLVKLTALAVALLVFEYAYYDNVNYSALYYANRQMENYVNGITIQARMTEGFTPDMEWALLGDIHDPLLESSWQDEATYGGSGFTGYLLNQYSRRGWFDLYVGYRLPLVSEERAQDLAQQEIVRAMPCWPAQGSIQIVEDTLVIKFEELEE